MTAPSPLRFGRFELQAHERRLLKDGEPVALGGRAFDMLLALAERPGRLVGKRALMELVWPGLVVQDNNLAAQVSALRKAVGDELIATIPGRGYRFTGHVEAAVPPQAAQGARPPALRTNLPPELPALLGRADDLAALAALVDAHRLVTIVGAGGIGKSLLAQHLLHARRGVRYAQGVCWVELASVQTSSALPGAVAGALGVEGGHGDALAALLNAVAPLEMLLALDNAEHLLADVAALAQALHDAAPALRIVVTSQAPLKLRAEQVWRIGPLASPVAGLPLAQASSFGAVALFAARAQGVERGFALTESNLPAVVEVCRTLDGLPLAIELAAARAPMLGMQGLLASMRDRLELLTASRDRAAPPRQQTLRAALEWSHGLLAPREQTVFRRLGVFAGSAALEWVLAVVIDDDGALDRWAVIDALDALIDRSLVAVLTAEHDGEPRYRLLESPRAFALERLDAAGERPALQRRHAHAVADFFDAAYAQYFSGRVGVDDWLLARADDFDNARDALRWARAADDAVLELRIGATLLRALPPSLHDERRALADACEARLDAAVPEALQRQVWIELNCVLADSQKARARHAAQRALQLARRLDAREADRFALYLSLCRCASAAAQAGELAGAHALLDEALALEDPAWPAQRLLWGAEAAQWCARMDSDGAEAVRCGRRLLALDRQRGSHAALAMGNLVDAELAAGDAAAAARAGAELVEALQGTRHEYGLACARINLLAAWLALGDRAAALALAQAVWAKAPMFDLQHAAAAYLALLCALQGRPRAAALLAGYSEALYGARGEARERNETAATLRAVALAEQALGAAAAAQQRSAGARVRDVDVAALAFGAVDA
jgi:predicted ATPase/DNA-binding winged helix-turn-helix (wHTH) protein